MKSYLVTFNLLMLLGFLTSCGSPFIPAENISPLASETVTGGAGSTKATAAIFDPLTSTSTPEAPQLILREEQNGGTFTLHQGGTFAIMLALDTEWELTYDPQYLELISPAGDTSSPGPYGWLFGAINSGTTVVSLKSKPPSESSGQEGIPAFIFQVTIEIAPDPSSSDVDLTLREENNGDTIAMQTGQEFAVILVLDAEWELTYDPQYLELLSPDGDPSSPGPNGWLFETLQPGTTKVQLKSKPPSDSSGQEGIPAFIFSVTIIVE